MAKTTWGRKETIIWPRHMPIYIYGLAFIVVASDLHCCVHSYSRRHAIGAVLPAGLRTHIGHTVRSRRRTGAPTGCSSSVDAGLRRGLP